MDWVRYRVGFYGSTRTYHGVFAQHGLEELGLKLHKMSLAGEWDKLAAEVSDDVVHLFAAVGTYDTIPGAIAERFGGVADWISFDFAPGTDPIATASGRERVCPHVVISGGAGTLKKKLS